MKRLIFNILALFCVGFSHAAEINIHALADTSQMLIGEQQNIRVSVEYNPVQTLVIPQIANELSHNILLTANYSVDTAKASNNNLRKIELNYPITCFDEGEYSFEIGPFVYNTDSVWSPAVKISVFSVELDSTATIKPLKPIQEPQYTFKDYISTILIVLGILLLITIIGFVAWKLWKQRKTTAELKSPQIIEQADIKALRELEELKTLNLCEKAEFKTFYTELTNILRAYFANVLHIDTFEKTTDELIREVVSTGKLPLSVIQNLQIILKEADFVKFAKHKPTVETGDLHYGLSLFCVNESKHLINQIENSVNQ